MSRNAAMTIGTRSLRTLQSERSRMSTRTNRLQKGMRASHPDRPASLKTIHRPTNWSPYTRAVTALDAGNNVTGYRGKVHFTSTDPKAVLPADYTFTGADAGVHTFSVTLKTVGTQSVRVRDTVTSTVTGLQSGIVVT